ncbi:hypothetical protein OIU77_029966 [Salix suchowensis]|uniref:Uncharacterized protein n=1 Tax=Salix suchowensis TaxID=1278906 RepID=A0ABQ9BC26_9ROSI|nr:hypothetical protein OIU77_029966 [Salix suchowensis]
MPGNFFLGNSNSEHAIHHISVELIPSSIIRQLKLAHKITIFGAYLKHIIVINVNKHIFSPKPRKHSSKHMGSRCFPPVYLGLS